MIYFVIQLILYSIPVAAVLFFFISLYRYCSARKKNKIEPGTFGTEEMKKRKILLIVSSVITGAFVVVIGSIYILLLMAVANM